MKYSKVIVMLIVCTLACSCAMKFGDNEMKVLRPQTMEGHATIQRAEMIGTQVTVSGRYGLPEWILGKVALTEYFLPKMVCTTVYAEDGVTKLETICEQMPNVSVEAKVDAKGGYIGDMVNVGDAALLGTGFEPDPESTSLWLEGVRAAVRDSELETQEKESMYKALENLGNLLKGVGNGE